jgi:protein TonB
MLSWIRSDQGGDMRTPSISMSNLRLKMIAALVAVMLSTIGAWAITHGWPYRPAAPQGIQPRVLFREAPNYSEEALRARINSSVVVSGRVNTTGVPEDLKVVRSAGFGLDEAALAACRHWRFAPGVRNGRPTSVGFKTTLAFRMPEPGVPTARLEFELPTEAVRPVLMAGSLSGLDIPKTPIDVRFEVTSQGIVEHVQCTSPPVAQRILEWHFKPATSHEVPIPARATLMIVGAY